MDIVKWKNIDPVTVPLHGINEQVVQYTTTESEVTLSIENVSATVGDSTELDVVLTDKNGITQRSEVGKTFIGGEIS